MDRTIVSPTLADAFTQAGMPYPGEAEPGRLRRFSTNGKQHDTAGWLRVFDDGDGAVFGSWRDGVSFVWQREKYGTPPSRVDIEALKAKAAQARQHAAAEREAGHKQAAQKAAQTWQASAPATTHSYLDTKLIKTHGARVSGDVLMIPVLDGEGNIQTLQTIMPDGSKRFMAGGKMAGGRYWLGTPTDAAPLVVCEGFATAAAIHEATGYAVACAFNAGNLHAVATDTRQRFPTARLLIAGDDDRSTEGNPGRTKATAAAQAVNGTAVFPELGPHGSDFCDMKMQKGRDALTRLIRSAASSERFKLLNGADLHALPPLQWRIKGVLPAHGLAALYGPSASGKSFLAMDMAAAIANGQSWFDCRVSAAPVVYVALEGEAGFKLRAQAWERHNAQSLPAGLHMVLQPFKLAEDVADLARVVPAGAVVFIDTLNRAAPTADENSSKDMGEILEAAKHLQALIAGLVVVVHHTGKDATKGLRGHSSLFAALDAAIEVSRNGERREWEIAKAKDGADGGAHPFKLQVVPLGFDDDSDAVTSCVVAPDTITDDIRRLKLPQGGNQKLILDAIRRLLQDAGPHTPPGMPGCVPSGKLAIELEAALPKLAESLTVAPDKRTSRTRDAITGLVTRGVLGFGNGWLWLE